MLFNNNFFIFILLPIIVSIYYFIPILFKYKGIYNKLWLILCSLFIYASFGYKGGAYLLLILAFNYCIGRLIIKNKRISNILFLSGLIFNISIWLLIKNYLFIENSYNFIFNTYYKFQHWYVPVGWGMIILQQIYYLIECKRKIILSYNVIDYLTFSLFFPKLIAGPLVSYNNFIANFSKKTFYFNYKNISAALFIFFYGLFLKVFFADTFFVIVEKGFLSNSLNFVQAWVISLCNIFSIFFDISKGDSFIV